MAIYNPRILASRLDDLIQELVNWTSATREARSRAAYIQRQAYESLHRATQRARIMVHQFEQDQDSVQRVGDFLSRLLDKCTEALSLAHQTVQQVETASELAYSTLKHWEEELEAAKAWLVRAKERLIRAKAALQQAQMDLFSAEQAQRSAQNALSACRNSERKNCYGEEAAVSRAAAQVRAAQAEVARAQREVRAAEEEVAQAEARVAACTQAVKYANEATSVAQAAVQNAQQALNYAERSMEYAEAAHKAMLEAKKALEEEEEAVSAMILAIRTATGFTDEAGHHLRQVDYYEESAQRYSLLAQQALQRSVQDLHQLNHPDLYNQFASFGSKLGHAISSIGSHVIPFLAVPLIATTLAVPPNLDEATQLGHALQAEKQGNVLQLKTDYGSTPESSISDLAQTREAAERGLHALKEAYDQRDEMEEQIERRLNS